MSGRGKFGLFLVVLGLSASLLASAGGQIVVFRGIVFLGILLVVFGIWEKLRLAGSSPEHQRVRVELATSIIGEVLRSTCTTHEEAEAVASSTFGNASSQAPDQRLEISAKAKRYERLELIASEMSADETNALRERLKKLAAVQEIKSEMRQALQSMDNALRNHRALDREYTPPTPLSEEIGAFLRSSCETESDLGALIASSFSRSARRASSRKLTLLEKSREIEKIKSKVLKLTSFEQEALKNALDSLLSGDLISSELRDCAAQILEAIE